MASPKVGILARCMLFKTDIVSLAKRSVFLSTPSIVQRQDITSFSSALGSFEIVLNRAFWISAKSVCCELDRNGSTQRYMFTTDLKSNRSSEPVKLLT